MTFEVPFNPRHYVIMMPLTSFSFETCALRQFFKEMFARNREDTNKSELIPVGK